MNNPYTGETAGMASDAANTRAFLQQAVDHYPRLAAFGFTLRLPCRENLADYQSLMLRFHTEVWQRTDEYSRNRQQARHHSPPTLLRWLWEAASAPESRVVLLLNLDTLGAWRDEVVQKEMSGILREAWRTVTGTDRNGVTGITPMILNRSVRGAFTRPFNQLKAQMQAMAVPVATAKTGSTG